MVAQIRKIFCEYIYSGKVLSISFLFWDKLWSQRILHVLMTDFSLHVVLISATVLATSLKASDNITAVTSQLHKVCLSPAVSPPPPPENLSIINAILVFVSWIQRAPRQHLKYVGSYGGMAGIGGFCVVFTFDFWVEYVLSLNVTIKDSSISRHLLLCLKSRFQNKYLFSTWIFLLPWPFSHSLHLCLGWNISLHTLLNLKVGSSNCVSTLKKWAQRLLVAPPVCK